MQLHPNAPVGEPFEPPTPTEITAEREQREREAAAVAGQPVPVADVQDRVLDGVPVRVYVPDGTPSTTARGVLVYLHGGGWVFGSIETADGSCRRLADRSGCVVASVEYGLSPEVTWPVAIEDGEAVLTAIRAGGLDDVEVEPSRVVVGGDSAGGFLAAVLARRARDDGRSLAGQVLVYPVVRRAALDDRDPSEGTVEGLSVAAMQWYWDQFLGDAMIADDARGDVDPMAAELAGLPPTLVLVAEHDILRHEGEGYAQALQAAGVEVLLTQWHGMPHGFFRLLTTYPAAAVAIDHVAAWCRGLLRSGDGA